MNDEARLVRKLNRDPAAILTDQDVAVFIASAMQMSKALFAPMKREPSASYLGDRLEDVIRWGPLAMRCQQAREKAGLDLKAAAKAVGIPRYRADAIERGYLGSFRPDLAWRYFESLGISDWVRRWSRANRELATRARISPASRKKGLESASAEAGNLTTRSTRRTPASRGLQGKPRATGRAR